VPDSLENEDSRDDNVENEDDRDEKTDQLSGYIPCPEELEQDRVGRNTPNFCVGLLKKDSIVESGERRNTRSRSVGEIDECRSNETKRKQDKVAEIVNFREKVTYWRKKEKFEKNQSDSDSTTRTRKRKNAVQEYVKEAKISNQKKSPENVRVLLDNQ
jgi:hypothetical protein